MKKSILIPIVLACNIFFFAFTQAPPKENPDERYIVKAMNEAQSNNIINLIKDGVFKPIAQAGWEEGVAALKGFIDPKFKPPVKGWIRDSMFLALQSDLEVIEFNDGNFYLVKGKGLILGDGIVMNVLPTIPTISAAHPNNKMPGYVFAFFQLPEGKSISKRSPIDAMKAYDLNPNDLSVKSIIPESITNAIKNNKSSSNQYLGLILVKRGNSYHLFPGDATKLIIDGDFGPATALKTTGDIQNLKGSDEELQAIKSAADNFLRSIRLNDQEMFNSLWNALPADLQSEKNMEKLLRNYRKLPGYVSADMLNEWIKVHSYSADPPCLGSDCGQDIYVVSYKLSEGTKASAFRAPTDIFHPLNFPGLDGSGKDPAYFAKALLLKEYEDVAIKNPKVDMNVLLGAGIGLKEYISVIIVKDESSTGSNLFYPCGLPFNIGMPPTGK